VKNNKVLHFVLGIVVMLFCVVALMPAVFAEDAITVDAVYGDTLVDVELPESYAWIDSDSKVGNVGLNTFKASVIVDGNIEETEVLVNVAPAYISNFVIETDGNKYYTGNPIEPEVKAYFKGEALKKDVDFKLVYENNIDVGVAKVTIEGIGNFKGKNSVSFYIEKIDVEYVILNCYEMELAPGSSFDVLAEVYPTNATFKDVVWTSEDEKVAAVDENGKVTAIANGSTYIVASSRDGNYEVSCKVNVVTHVADVIVTVGGTTMFYKETYQLKTIIAPFGVSDDTIIWSSSDESVATVDENGLVTAVGRGNAIITATTADGGFTDTCEIKVSYTWWQYIIWLFLGCIWYFR
jgi:transglutaminase/protease-like cytokinesis protein 3